MSAYVTTYFQGHFHIKLLFHTSLVFPMQTKQRDNESRLYYQALKEHRMILGDLQTKDAFIRDQQKKIRELEAELVDFVHAYDVRTACWKIVIENGLLCKGKGPSAYIIVIENGTYWARERAYPLYLVHACTFSSLHVLCVVSYPTKIF